MPAGVNESRTICENTPKNNAKTISTCEKSPFGKMNKLRKNNGRKIIKRFLFKNKKLTRAIKMPNIRY